MLPPIPETTIRAARASYGKGNVYLRLGDRINGLISKLDADLLTVQSDGYMGTLLAALTTIQCVEGLTDNELTESLQRRIDLRYALHLPYPGPRIDPVTLCAFRQRVFRKEPYCLLLKEIFNVLAPELGVDALSQEPDACQVINSICLNTIRAAVVEAMFHAIEALSANHFAWLRQVALPHWYERYSHSLMMHDAGISIRQKDYTTEDLRADIQYLLQAVDQSKSRRLSEVPEIRILQQMWNDFLHYRPEDQCAYCFNHPFERRATFDSTNKNLTQAQ